MASESESGPLPVTVERVRAVWSALAGVEGLTELQVIVRPESLLSPEGWCGLLALDGTLTVVVPAAAQVASVQAALLGLTPAEATTPSIVVGRFGEVVDVLGPAGLFYPTAGLPDVSNEARHERADLDELCVGLLDEVSSEEANESGLAEIAAPAFVVREGPAIVAACGWQIWPHGVAHMCVLTRPTHRQRGLARRVALQAVHAATSQGLLPQWRARPPASRQLAVSIGLVNLGAQLSLRLG